MAYLRQYREESLRKFIYGSLLVLIVCTNDVWTAQRFCGTALQEVLNHVCVNGFNSKLRNVKKSVEPAGLNYHDLKDDIYGSQEKELMINNDIKDIEDNLPLDSFNANNLFLDKLFGEALNQMVSTNRRRRHFGVYNECCSKPCTYSELMTYCL